MADIELQGSCDDGFSAVKDAFHNNFTEHDELGAGVRVIAGGRTVVDLWGGFADVGRTRPWERDTLVNVWSTTKGLVALCVQVLVDRGQLTSTFPSRRIGRSSRPRERGRCPCATSSATAPG